MYKARVYKGEIEINGYSTDGVGYAINALFSRCVDLERYMEADEVIIIYRDNEEIMRGNAKVLHKLCDVFENPNQKV
jgi:hypothetical protein